MALIDRLKTDVNEALKAGDSFKAEALRGFVASVHNEEIALRAKSKELSDEDTVRVLRGEAKKRKEAMELYNEAGRSELAEKERKELDIVGEYLPEELSEEKVRMIVDNAVEAVGGDNFGLVMKAAMGEIAGRADAGFVSQLVKEKLED